MATSSTNDDYLLYQVARMYYIKNQSQEDIAKAIGFSRSYVSRLLDKAKERRIVTFVVTNPLEENIARLEEDLSRLYNLKFVAIAGVSDTDYPFLSFTAQNRILANKANAILPEFLAASKTVAVGFGHALYTMSKTLEPTTLRNDVLFMPAIGTTSASDPQTQSNIIVDNLSSAFGARRYFTNVPILMERQSQMGSLFQARHEELLQLWSEVDTVIVGLGVRYHMAGDVFSLVEASEHYRKKVAAEETVGDILTRYFKEDGSEILLDSSYVRNALKLERLRSIDRVLCVAGGPQKVRGIRTALKAGYINCLVTDLITARELAQLEEEVAL